MVVKTPVICHFGKVLIHENHCVFKNKLLVTSIQEFGNTTHCEPVIIVERRESRLRHRMSEPIIGVGRHESRIRHYRMSNIK